MADQKTRKTRKKKGNGGWRNSKAALDFNFGFNVPTTSGKKRKPAGGGSV